MQGGDGRLVGDGLVVLERAALDLTRLEQERMSVLFQINVLHRVAEVAGDPFLRDRLLQIEIIGDERRRSMAPDAGFPCGILPAGHIRGALEGVEIDGIRRRQSVGRCGPGLMYRHMAFSASLGRFVRNTFRSRRALFRACAEKSHRYQNQKRCVQPTAGSSSRRPKEMPQPYRYHAAAHASPHDSMTPAY